MNLKQISKILMVACFALTFAQSAKAQMQPAKRIDPKVVKGVSLNASVAEVWSFVSSPKQFYEAIAEVTDLKCPAIGEGAKLSFVIPGDSQRKQEVSLINKTEQIIAYYITQSDYYHQPLVYRMQVGADEDKAYVQFDGIFSTGDKEKDKSIEKLVVNEWLLMKKALEQKFN